MQNKKTDKQLAPRKHYLKNREEILRKQKAYYAKNRRQRIKSSQKYYQEHKEEINIQVAKHRGTKSFKDKASNYNKQYYLDHKAEIDARNKKNYHTKYATKVQGEE